MANRVHAAARRLQSDGNRIVARYTDDKRHCLYYITGERLFRYDVITDRNHEVDFANCGYQRIVRTYISQTGRYLFVDIDRDSQADEGPLASRRELWAFDSYSGQSHKVGDGFYIDRHRDSFVIKRRSRCLNPEAPAGQQRWMVRDHYYYLQDGRNIWAKEEYEYKKKE